MPIFELEGKKYRVQDSLIGDFTSKHPNAVHYADVNGNKYRVKARDYEHFVGDLLRPKQNQPTPERGEGYTDNGFLGDQWERFQGGASRLAGSTLNLLDKGTRQLEKIGIPRGGAFEEWAKSANEYADKMSRESDRYNGKGFSDLWKEGRYLDALGSAALSATESAPLSLGIMASTVATGGMAPGLMAAGAVTASDKYDQLEKEKPSMGEGAKWINALVTGGLEAATESVGAGLVGKAVSRALKAGGRDLAAKQVKKLFIDKMADFEKKHWITAPIGSEAIEEVANAIGEYAVDKLTGVERTDDLVKTIIDSAVGGAMGGAQFTPITGIAHRYESRQKKKLADSYKESRVAAGSIMRDEMGNFDEVVLKYADNPHEAQRFVDRYASVRGITGDNLQAIRNYARNLLQYNSYIEQVKTEIDDTIKQRIADVDKTANKDMGMVVSVKRPGEDNPTYITGGHIAFDEEGNVDVAHSDKTIYFLDADGKVQQATPKMFESLVDEVPIDQMYADIVSSTESEIIQREENDINPPAFEVGSSVTLKDGRAGVIQSFGDVGNPIVVFPDNTSEEVDFSMIANNMSVNQPQNEVSSPSGQSKVSESAVPMSTESESQNINQQPTAKPIQPTEQVVNDFPRDNKGNYDFDSFTPKQRFDYTSTHSSKEDALSDIALDMEEIKGEIASVEEELKSATRGKRIRLREELNAKKNELAELEEIYNSVAPVEEQATEEVPTQTEEQTLVADQNLEAEEEVQTDNEEAPVEEQTPMLEQQDEISPEVKSENEETSIAEQEGASGGVKESDSGLFNYFTGSLSDLIEQAKMSAGKLIKKIVSPVSDRLKNDLERNGVYITNEYNHVIDNNAIRHALKKHGGNSETKRGQVPIKDSDFDKISDIVENYDDVKVEIGKRGDVNIIYSKSYNDGATIFVEEKRNKRKELAAVTMWKMKNPILTDANSDNTTPISDLNRISKRKANNSLSEKQANNPKIEEGSRDGATLTDNVKEGDTVGGSPVALSYLLEGGEGSIINAGYFLHGVAAAFPAVTDAIETIRQTMLQDGRLGESPLDFVSHDYPEIENIRSVINNVYGAKGVDLYNKLLSNASGFVPREGRIVERQLEELTPIDSSQEYEAAQESAGESIKPIGKGVFGDIYDQFRGKAKEAIKFLLSKRSGEAIGALHHKEVGDIDLVWGKEGTGKSNGFGLSKLAKFHPEVLDSLQDILDDMVVISRSANRVNLESKTHKAAVRLEWDGENKNWLLTAFEKEKPTATDRTTDIGDTELQNDTAPLQTESSSTDKDSDSSRNTNDLGEKIVDAEVKADVAQEEQGIDKTVREQFGSYKKGDKFIDDGPFGTGKVLTLSEFEGSGINPIAILHDEKGNVYKELYSNIGTLLLPLNDNNKNTRKQKSSEEQQAVSEKQANNPKKEEGSRDGATLTDSTIEENMPSKESENVVEEQNAISESEKEVKNSKKKTVKIGRDRGIEERHKESNDDINSSDGSVPESTSGEVGKPSGNVKEVQRKKRGAFFRLKAMSEEEKKRLEEEEKRLAKERREAELKELFEKEREKFANVLESNEYAQGLRKNTWREAIAFYRKRKAEMEEIAKDWASRVYKKNGGTVLVRSDVDMDGWEYKSVDSINERRRRRKINLHMHYAQEFDEYAKALMSRIGANESDLNDTSSDDGNKDVRLEKASDKSSVSSTEKVLRDSLVKFLRKIGIEVITDIEAAHRVLEEENGKVKLSAKQKRALETASLFQKEKDQPTVVSSADGTKVLNNLDNLTNELEEKSNYPKTFLGELAKALGASAKGSSSQYATFETKNGDIVTIRLANHNASSKRMDDAGRDNAISIVISPKANEGITDDGNAHIVEFFYDAIKLRKADGKPLAAIVRSIKQSLYSGEYKDTTGLAKRQEVNVPYRHLREHRVFHGSGAEFDAFDHSHMGEGEGVQAYGWGTYVTEVEGIGRMYAESYKASLFKSGFGEFFLEELKGASKEDRFDEVKQQLLDHYRYLYDSEKAKGVKEDDEFISDYEMLKRIKEEDIPSKFLYTVEIPEDNGENYLHWDGRADMIVDRVGVTDEEYEQNDMATGEDVYHYLSSKLGSDRKASEFLSSLGFAGISYPAEATTGGRKDGARNFVIFNEADAQITDHIRFFRTKNGEAYGFTVNGKIYLDPKIATAETPIHEYAHLWATAMQKANPNEWKNIVDLMKDTSLWNEIKKSYPELKTDDEIADEVLAHYSGQRGAERLRAEQERIVKGSGTILEKIHGIAAIQNVRDALNKFWKGVADFLGVHFTTAEEVADKVLADMLSGVDPKQRGVSGKMREQFVGEKGAANMDKGEEATIRLDNLNVAREMEKADKDAKSIKLATGWERGADGKWRYEVMDGELNKSPKVEIKETYDRENYYTTTLGEILQNESLYEAYPQLKDLPIVIQEMDNTTLGSYLPATLGYPNGYITLSMGTYRHHEKVDEVQKEIKQIEATPEYKEYSKYFDKEIPESYKGRESEWEADMDEAERKFFASDLGKRYYELMWGNNGYQTVYGFNEFGKSIILHEVQHAIQHIEGFAVGGNINKISELRYNIQSAKEGVYEYMKELGMNGNWNRNVPSEYFSTHWDDGRYFNDAYIFAEALLPEEKKEEVVKFLDRANMVIRNNVKEIGVDNPMITPSQHYKNLAGEVEARNVQNRMNMTEEERRNSLASETEDVARKDQIFIMENAGKAEMGSRVDKRMEEIEKHFNNVKLEANQQAVVDVFSGKADNNAISVERKDGKRKVVMRQGNENRAGAKHSLYRHYERNEGSITADDILLIPEVLGEGEVKAIKNGKGKLYTLEKDGVKYKVYTEINSKNNKEEFCDFYTNKKVQGANSYISERDAQNGNTQLSARITSPQTSAKIEETSETASDKDKNLYRESTGEIKEESGRNNEEYRNIASEAEQLASSLNTPVRIIRDVNEITDQNKEKEKRMRNSKGWYDTKSGEVVIVLPNATGVGDVQATVLHEVVAHKGLRGLLGEKMDEMLDNVFKSVPTDIREKIAREAIGRYGGNVRVATEEYLASIAEKGVKEPAVWKKIKSAIRNFFRSMGINLKMTDEDIAYLLWKSKNRLTRGDSYHKIIDKSAKDARMREGLLYRSPVMNSGTLLGEEPGNRRNTIESVSNATDSLSGNRGAMVKKAYQKLREGYQDKMISLRRFQEDIVKDGHKLRDHEDAYIYENTSQSKANYDLSKYRQNEFKGLVDEVTRLSSSGGKMNKEKARQVENYMMIKHGLERNEYMRNKAIEEYEAKMDKKLREYEDELDRTSKDKKANSALIAEKTKEIEEAKNKMRKKMEKKDFSGLTAIGKELFPDHEGEVTEDMLLSYAEHFEQNNSTDELWRLTKEATDATLDMMHKSNLISTKVRDELKERYKHYIPLKEWDQTTAGDLWDYVDSDRDIVSSPIKTAKGRTSRAGNVLANIISDYESATVMGYKNLTKLRFLNLVRNSGTGMATVSEQWYRKTVDGNGNEVWEAVSPDNLTEDAERNAEIINEFEDNMKDFQEKGDVKTEKEVFDLGLPIKRWQEKQHTVRVKEGGKDVLVYINGNPNVSQALNGQNNHNLDNWLIRKMNNIRQFMMLNYTSRSINFMFRNLIRDLLYVNTMNFVKYGAGFEAKYIKNYFKASRIIYNSQFRGKENDLYEAFLKGGGRTGYVGAMGYEVYKKEIEKMIHDSNNGRFRVKDAFNALGRYFEIANTVIEDSARFATYMTSKEVGMSELKSINAAKEASVNFNRRGSGAMGAAYAQSFYFFFNASIQGTHNFMSATKQNPKRAAMAIAMWSTLGFAYSILSSMLSGDDDDEYNDIPDYVRQNNLIFPLIETDTYALLPLPVELRAFFGMGDILAQYARGGYKGRDFAGDMALKMLELSPIGIEGVLSDDPAKAIAKALIPDATSPVTDTFVFNENFFGKRVTGRNDHNKYVPEYHKVTVGTSKTLQKTSEKLNSLTGGDYATKGWADKALLNPSAVEYLFEQYLGGVGKAISQAYKTAEWAFTGEGSVRNIPIISGLTYSTENMIPQSHTNERYNKIMNDYEEAKSRERMYMKGLKEGEKLLDPYKEFAGGKGYRAYKVAEMYKSVIDNLYETAKSLDGEEKKAIFMRAKDLKEKMINDIDKINDEE